MELRNALPLRDHQTVPLIVPDGGRKAVSFVLRQNSVWTQLIQAVNDAFVYLSQLRPQRWHDRVPAVQPNEISRGYCRAFGYRNYDRPPPVDEDSYDQRDGADSEPVQA